MRGLVLLAALAIGLQALATGKKSYEGYQIVRLSPQHEKHVAFIAALQTEDKLTVLHGIRGVGHHSFVLVPPSKVSDLLETVTVFELPYKVTVADLSERIAAERLDHQLDVNRGYDPLKYNTYDDQVAYLKALAAKNLQYVQYVKVIGQSTEKRDIYAVRLGYPSDKPKKVFLIDGGIHAREWISHSVAFHVLDKFTSPGDYETQVLKDIDIIIIPVVNPDGYVYAMTKDRMWRKNRRPGSGSCSGVDLNRNFPFKYGVAGTSNNICDETYDGPSASSEPETQVFRAFVDPLASTIGGYITFHSYGQLILYPWGYAYNTYPPDVNDLISAGNAMRDAIRASHKKKYVCENSAGLYPASGASDDYCKSIGVKYVYTIELRPDENDWDGFELPASQIPDTGDESYAATKVLIDLVRKL